MYDLDDFSQHAFSSLCESFDNIATCSKMWNINTTGPERDWKRNAGARRIVDRSSAKLSYSTPTVIRTNISIPAITGGKQSVYFFPDIALVKQGRHIGAIAYSDLAVDWGASPFIEEEGVPRDAVIDRYTWRYVNRSGEPDRRFNNNKQLPVVRYQVMDITGSNHFHKILHLPKLDDYRSLNIDFSSLGILSRGSPISARDVDQRSDALRPASLTPTLSWKFPPDAAKTKNKVQVLPNASATLPSTTTIPGMIIRGSSALNVARTTELSVTSNGKLVMR